LLIIYPWYTYTREQQPACRTTHRYSHIIIYLD
jgi:hypothetical protein